MPFWGCFSEKLPDVSDVITKFARNFDKLTREKAPMKKLALLLLLLSAPFLTLSAESRKKVAVVLSGGGAKGAAQVGALKVIEEIGIPVDIVVGSSIGAVVGGLYAVGYTATEMEEIVKKTNWMEFFTDRVMRNNTPFPYKHDDSRHLFSVALKKKERNNGVIRGRNIYQFISELTKDYNHVRNFDRLPIPFACVATDMVTDKKVVIREGHLPTAIRSSMAVPVVFSPIVDGEKMLIDGGMTDIMPVQVAKDMGADIIIAIDVHSERAGFGNLKTIIGTTNQFFHIVCQSELDAIQKNVDSHIRVDVQEFSIASFTPSAMDTLLVRGEQAARASLPELLKIKELAGEGTPRDTISQGVRLFTARFTKRKINQFKLGFRMDSEDIAAVLADFNFPDLKFGTARFTLRGGRQSHLSMSYGIPMGRHQSLTLSNRTEYNDFFIYTKGKKTLNPASFRNTAALTYALFPAKSFIIEAGAAVDYYRYIRTLNHGDADLPGHSNPHLNYFVNMTCETLNKRYYPTQGMKLELGGTMHHNLRTHKDFPVVSGNLEGVIPLGRNTFVTPKLCGRFVLEEGIPFAYSNFAGGDSYHSNYAQQIPLPGTTHTEAFDRFLGNVQLEVRQRICHYHNLILTGHCAINHDSFSRFFKQGKKIAGGHLGYGYETPFGPVEALVGYSSLTKKPSFFINIGFGF